MSETFDLSELLDAVLLAAERGTPAEGDEHAALLRALHTLKGNAGMLGYRPMQALVHRVEDAFKGGGALPLAGLLEAAAALHRAVDRLATNEGVTRAQKGQRNLTGPLSWNGSRTCRRCTAR